MGSNLAIVESFHPCKSPSHDTAMARTTCWPTHHPPTPLFMGTDFERVAPALSIPLLLILVKSGLNDQPVTIWLRSLLNPSWLCLSSILFCSLRVVRWLISQHRLLPPQALPVSLKSIAALSWLFASFGMFLFRHLLGRCPWYSATSSFPTLSAHLVLLQVQFGRGSQVCF